MPHSTHSAKPIRILIVEDETIIARDIELQLGNLGYQSAGFVTTAEEAITTCGQLQPDLVLMDIALAGPMDGIEAAQWIRTQFGIPVVLLTAYASDDYLLRAKIAEPFGYILKPFSPREMRITLELALYKHQTEVQLMIGNSALRAISQGVLITDCEHRVQLLNAAFSHITGLDEADLQHPWWQCIAAPNADPATLQALHAASAAPTEFTCELFAQRKNGTPFWCELTLSPIRHPIGHITHVIYLVRDISKRKQALEQLRELSLHQMQIKEEEHKQIAREIHDDLGSLLYGIQTCLSTFINQSKPVAAPALLQAQEMSSQALDTMRNLIANLRPSTLDQLGLWATLEWYCQQIEKRTNLRCDYLLDEELEATELDANLSTCIFRIVQELLSNVIRHAKASVAEVRVTYAEKRIHIEVEDDGIGINESALLGENAWGIMGMYERAQPFQGELKIRRKDNGGTLAILQFPWERSHA